MKRVYLDHNATTAPDPRVLERVHERARVDYGNPSSAHLEGQHSRRLIEESRSALARVINAFDREIIFTGGGTEANNLAIKGAVEARSDKGRHLMASTIEHQSVRRVFLDLERRGFQVSWLPVDKNGVVELDYLEKHLRDDTILVSVMLANNETGAVQPVKEIANLAHGKNALFHSDAVAALGKIPVNAEELGADLMTFSGHKIYAFKGVGALYLRRGTELVPQMLGGHQEHGRRAGTENMPGILSFAEAVNLFRAEGAQWLANISRLRDMLEQGIASRFPSARINGQAAKRAPNTCNVRFPGVDGENLLMNLDALGVSVSTGAACQTGATDPSHVLAGMGLSEEEARGTIRISLGKDNTEEEIKFLLDALDKTVGRIKKER